MEQAQVYSVGQLTALVKQTLDREPRLSNAAVEGEISNFRHYPSGHMYFTLKDSDSRLRSVMFRRENSRLTFKPADGMAVVARGDVSVYVASGEYQLYVRELLPAGHGALAAAFEQLKQRLAAEGLFAEERKRPLPLLPKAVGIVTSVKGAALRDILSVTWRRYPDMPVIVAAALVQGEEGPDSVVRAIRSFADRPDVDVLIVGRGGGSLEDLWTFNDERVARAISASPIPVISAVGHETDFTIADFVADKRAATPSAAAELAVPEKAVFRRSIDALADRVRMSLERRLERARLRLHTLADRSALSRPDELMRERRQRVDDNLLRAERVVQMRLDASGRRLAAAAAKLEALSPLATLARGYAIPRRPATGQVVRAGGDVAVGDELAVVLADAQLLTRVEAVQLRRVAHGSTSERQTGQTGLGGDGQHA